MASSLYHAAQTLVQGPVSSIHTFIRMADREVDIGGGQKTILCKAAMGYSFAAGTTDGPGFFTFKQGDNSGNEFWNRIRDFIKEPTQEQIDCQYPKPV